MLPEDREDGRLLSSMGYETGNIHMGSPRVIKAVQKHLKALKRTWLLEASSQMVKAVKKDWQAWRAA
jgi:hypothetical protein